jgi:DNA-binding NarL/FixJ family response regulator
LLAGKASKEIAAALGRSDYTIRNQTKCIFRAFDVRSRAALLVRCQREGITPEFEAAGA